MDAGLAFGIASLEQMQRIQDDTWQGASTDSDDEIDDSVLANLQLPTSTDSTLGGVLVWMHCGLLASPVWSRCSESRTIPGRERARTAATKSMIRSWQTCSCLSGGTAVDSIAACFFYSSACVHHAGSADGFYSWHSVARCCFLLNRSCPHWLSRWMLRFARVSYALLITI